MRTLLRCLSDTRHLWRVWGLVLIPTFTLPPLALSMPLVERELIDAVIIPRRLDLLPQTLALYAVIWLMSTACSISGSVGVAYLLERMMNDLRQRVLRHGQVLSVAFSRQQHSGRTMALFGNDVPSVVGGIGGAVISAIGSVVGVLLGAWIMLSLNWQLAIVAGILPPLVAGVAAVVTRPLRRATRRVQDKAAELTEQLHENLAGVREIITFGRERVQMMALVQTLNHLLRLRMRVTGMTAVVQSGHGLVSLTVTLVIIGYGGYLVMHDEATLGTLVAMQSLFGLVFVPAGQIFGAIVTIQKALASADRLYAFLDREPDVLEHPEARPPSEVVGSITFEHVSFAYEEGRPVLQDVTLSAQAGETIALIGPSGAGKTTLTSLVARFYDPDLGVIRLDGVDLQELTLDGVRKHIGFVFQDTFLFASTLRDNIAFGTDHATDDEIIAAAKSANAWEFIEQMPDGLHTQIGERGLTLSEGQKQRVAIARALLRNPRILILDEPTSALDARSEHLIQTALDRLMVGRTTFVIAHRLATVRRASNILVLEKGRIVQEGCHDELINIPGLYRDLFELQSRPGEAVGT